MGRHDRSRTRAEKRMPGRWKIKGDGSGRKGAVRVPQHEPVKSEVLKSRAKILLREKLFSDIGFALAARATRFAAVHLK